MAGNLVMKEMDLIELYQLLSLYRRTYLEDDETIAAGPDCLGYCTVGEKELA